MPRVALVAAVALLFFAGCGLEVGTGGGPVDGDGYGFEAADDWKDTTEDAPSIGELGIDDPAVAAVSVDAVVSTDASEDFGPNLTIVTTPAGKQDDPVKLAEVNLRGARSQGSLPPGAGGGGISAEDSEVEEIELGGEPAASYEQVADAPPGEVRQRQIFAIQGGTAYAVTYSALADGQFEENLPAVEQMLDSWTWD